MTPTDFRKACPNLAEIYIAAMGHDRSVLRATVDVWRRKSTLDGFVAVSACHEDQIVGFAFGYPGDSGRWWQDQIVKSLKQLHRYEQWRDLMEMHFHLTEIHVAPGWQGHRLGERMLRELLAHTRLPRALLSTPEVPREDNRAFRLYRRLGFYDVARIIHFPGSREEWAIMAADLPLR